MSNERQARLADRIRVLIAERLEKGLRDPRLGFVTITDVRVTGDLQHASVFYTVYGDDQAPPRSRPRPACCAARWASVSASGSPRRSSSSPTRFPRTPGTSRSCCARRRSAMRPWQGLRRRAGDADPYVKPREDDDED
jgi:ribosome-binding factor A